MYQRYKEIMAEQEAEKPDPVGLTDAEVAEACKEPEDATKGFYFQQTMYRIKDPRKSLEFYTKVLGMRLLKKFDFSAMKFSVYYLGHVSPSDIPDTDDEKAAWIFTQISTVALTYNWEAESDPDFKGYHNGNSQPKGFGHIGVVVPDVEVACERFEQLGVNFIKKPDEGNMKGLAFIQDPDGYWIEILSPALGPAVQSFCT